MGTSAPQYCKPRKHDIGLIKSKEPKQLLAFTIKNYYRNERIGDHPEVEALIES